MVRRSLQCYLAGDGEHWQQEVISLLQDIGVCPEHDLTDYELLVRSRIYAVWDQMTHHAAYTMREKSGKHSSERLAPVVEYMHQNYAYEITLAELAALLPMSEGQFCRVFKQVMKLSPMQYLMRYRILQSAGCCKTRIKSWGDCQFVRF